jgi:hypothetical protein
LPLFPEVIRVVDAAPPRPPTQRKADAFQHLEHDVDAWIATADLEGNPCLVPLSFIWDGEAIVLATHANNPTALNIMATHRVRVILGHTRDVVLMDTSADVLENIADDLARAYLDKCQWDPRNSKGYEFYCLAPNHVESWRELNEHSDRELMREGKWLV